MYWLYSSFPRNSMPLEVNWRRLWTQRPWRKKCSPEEKVSYQSWRETSKKKQNNTNRPSSNSEANIRIWLKNSKHSLIPWNGWVDLFMLIDCKRKLNHYDKSYSHLKENCYSWQNPRYFGWCFWINVVSFGPLQIINGNEICYESKRGLLWIETRFGCKLKRNLAINWRRWAMTYNIWAGSAAIKSQTTG